MSNVLAIGEPEAHLHPQLQRSLFRYFLGKKQPILLTTHSPNIASVSPVERAIEHVINLRRVEDAELIINREYQPFQQS